jgi:hypothetical protein
VPKESLSIEIRASCQTVFDLIHDYGRRLEWDSMLSRAALLGGAPAAALGVRSLCVGTWRSGFMGMETEYVRFERGCVAAVKLTNRPAFFGRFAATIRHSPLADGRSLTTYIYAFRARPRFLAFLLEPIMNLVLARQIRGRLKALRNFLEQAGDRTT